MFWLIDGELNKWRVVKPTELENDNEERSFHSSSNVFAFYVLIYMFAYTFIWRWTECMCTCAVSH